MSALDDDHLPAKQRSLRTLANLSRLDLGISEAIDAGIMARLAAVLDPAAALPGARAPRGPLGQHRADDLSAAPMTSPRGGPI